MVVSARSGPPQGGTSRVPSLHTGVPPQSARQLRTAVFVEEQGVPERLEHDDVDPLADHVVIEGEDGGAALATARLLDPEAIPGLDLGPAAGAHEPWAGDPAAVPIGVIGRVAVRADVRGQGLARTVTLALERRAVERGLAAIRLHAQVAVAGLYEGLGYRSFGPPDRTAGIDHVWMAKPLVPGLRPVRDGDGPALEVLIGGAWSEYPGCVLDVDGEEPWMRAPATTYSGDVAPGPGRYRGAMWVVPDSAADPPRLAASVAVRETARSTVELKSLYVAAAARRRGLGAALVLLVEREARRRGATVVELWSDTRFADAHRLYERLGYTRASETRDLHDRSNTTEYRYTKGLAVRP